MTYSIYHDWSNYNEHYRNHGRSVAEEMCTHKEAKNLDTNMREKGYCDTCGFSEDSCQPMINYLYPLDRTDFDDDEIYAVIQHTNCTVIEDEDTRTWYLTLCGGGMDLSQDIALAYHLLEKWIPYELCVNVSTQEGISVHGKNWNILRTAMIQSLTLYEGHAKRYKQNWKKTKKTTR